MFGYTCDIHRQSKKRGDKGGKNTHLRKIQRLPGGDMALLMACRALSRAYRALFLGNRALFMGYMDLLMAYRALLMS